MSMTSTNDDVVALAQRLLACPSVTPATGAVFAELEAMLATHQHLHGLMADTVVDAESARDEAEAARRLAETNLDILRGEFERLQATLPSRA